MHFYFETHDLLLAFDSLSEQCVTLTNSVGCPIYLECSTLTLFEEFAGNSLTTGDSYSAAGTSSSWRISGSPRGISCAVLLFWRRWRIRWWWRRFLHYLTVSTPISLIDKILLNVFNHCVSHYTLEENTSGICESHVMRDNNYGLSPLSTLTRTR
jgi:hypothetical protein